MFTISLEQYESLMGTYTGFCVEPDACMYKCEECGEYAVYGLDELLLTGRVE